MKRKKKYIYTYKTVLTALDRRSINVDEREKFYVLSCVHSMFRTFVSTLHILCGLCSLSFSLLFLSSHCFFFFFFLYIYTYLTFFPFSYKKSVKRKKKKNRGAVESAIDEREIRTKRWTSDFDSCSRSYIFFFDRKRNYYEFYFHLPCNLKNSSRSFLHLKKILTRNELILKLKGRKEEN